MKSTLWPCLAAMMLALGASACSESSKPSNQTACDPACGDGLVCNEVSGQCVGCLTNADCSAPASQCRMSDFVCVSCLTDSDCLLGYECNQTRGTCEEGEEPVECDATHPCDGADEECVAGRCVVDVDCTPEDEVFSCPGSECTADGVCLNQKQVPCRDAAPAYATNLDATVTITWTAETQWSTPKACEWRCDDGFTLTSDGTACETTVTTECTMANQATTCPNGGECTAAGTCLTSKLVACTDAAPSNATSREEQVSITWTANGGWSAPKNCQWSCDDGFERSADGKACVAIATTECTAANQATTCPNGGECTAAGTCRTSKSVQCADAAPSNATSTVTNVTIAWDAATGWDTPATCAWTCDDGFQKTADGKACEYSCMAGTCSDNAYCNSQHKLQSCGGNVCVADRGCMEPTCTASSGCTATFETCNTSANSGLGECVPATCSSSTCSGDYACQGGKWTECAHGCASGSCKAAPVGCAAKADPDDWCMNNDANPLCDLNTGNCVECLVDGDCGTDQECASNTCRDLCGNGIVDSGEECDPNASSSTWQYQGKCSGVYNTWVGELTCNENCELDYADCTYCGNGIGSDQEYCDPTADKSEWDVSTCDEWAKYEGDTENTWIGELSCNADCTPNIDQCEVDGCANVQSDGECVNNGAAPVTCLTAFGETEGLIPDAYVVCVAHDTCPGVMVMDFDATWAACVAEEKAVDWCRLQSHNGDYAVILDASAPSTNFYGQINVNNVTGTNGSGSTSIKGQFVYWDEEFENMKTIDATKTTLDANSGGQNNDQWVANVSVSDFKMDGLYYYSWRFSADNGFSWYYCHNEETTNGTGTGAATTNVEDVQLEFNELLIEKPAQTTVTENFANMTNRNSCTASTGFTYADTGTFVGNDSVAWEYKGFACAAPYTEDESSKGVGIGQKSNNGNYLQASNIPAGVGVVTIKYKFNNVEHTGTLEIYMNGETTASATASIKGSNHDATTGFGTAAFTVNKAGTSMKIAPKYLSANNTFLISEVSWTSYP